MTEDDSYLIDKGSGYLRSELRSLGVEPRELKRKELDDLLDFVKQEQIYNYRKAYPPSQ